MSIASNIETVLQLFFAGLLIGSLYGLMCVGLGLIFGIMRVINFAQGDFLMLGMYLAFFFVQALLGPGAGAPLHIIALSALLTLPVLFMVGYLVQGGLIGRVSGAKVSTQDDSSHFAQLILTLGLSLIIQNGGLMIFGSTPVSVRTPLSSQAVEFGPFYGDLISIFLNKARLAAAAGAVLATVAAALFLSRTDIGRRLRAAADNPTAALYVGIDVAKAYRIAFGLGVALTAMAGVLVATFYPFQPYVGLDFVIIMYAGVVLGGMGSLWGAFAGGVIIGLVQQMSTLILPVQLQNSAIFVVFLLVLMFRPQGLFGKGIDRA